MLFQLFSIPMLSIFTPGKRLNISKPRILILMVFAVSLIAFVSAPVPGGIRYMSGSPSLPVGIVVNNEFTPGTTIPLKLQFHNNKFNPLKLVQPGNVDSDDAKAGNYLLPVIINYFFLGIAEKEGTNVISFGGIVL